MRVPNFSARVEQGVMVIIDNFNKDNPSPTVTNGIETVLGTLQKAGVILPPLVIYKDTDGIWDGVKHNNGHFVNFYPIRMTDMDKAISYVKEFVNAKGQ